MRSGLPNELPVGILGRMTTSTATSADACQVMLLPERFSALFLIALWRSASTPRGWFSPGATELVLTEPSAER